MCSNYQPVTRMDRLLTFFGVERHRDEVPPEFVFPMGTAPFIRLDAAGSGPNRLGHVVDDAVFRFVPDFASKMEWAKKTYNARSETVASKSSYSKAWADGQRCIIPAEAFFEPRYFGTVERPGTSQRWGIRQPGDVPMGIAGIYRTWVHPETGEVLFAMSMLTVNADGHPVMQQFFKPGEEKRMVVILHPDDHAEWLSCPVAVAPKFFRTWSGPLEIFAAQLPPRAPRTSSGKVVGRRANPDPETGDLF